MSDFPELENQLKQLRPITPSEDLIERIEHELTQPETVSDTKSAWRWRWPWKFSESPYHIGLGLAAAVALVLIFTRLNLQPPVERTTATALITPPPASEFLTGNA